MSENLLFSNTSDIEDGEITDCNINKTEILKLIVF